MPPEANTVGLKHHIDQPGSWDSLSRCLIVRGWCFGENGQSIRNVRLRTGALIFPGAVGFARPDVKAALPEAPDDSTGFEIRGMLPSGRIEITIEAELTGGAWQVLFQRTVTVKRQLVPLWLGGGAWTELMYFQMPAHMVHAPKPVHPEKFPGASARPTQPKISLVTPSYNQARFLPETTRSVLDQPGVRCEYVIQDGGSTDGSREIIEHLVPRLHARESAPDRGQADAIAKGFAKTSGGPDDLMAWINSDDFYLPGALAFVADYFARHPDVDVLYGNRIVVNDDSREVARWFLPQHDPEVLRLNDFVPQETLFWRRRIWDKAGGIDASFKFALDWDLLLRFQAAGAKIVHVPYFLACFRVHSAQKTTAQMHTVGQQEITKLRERTFARPFPATELETHPRLLHYLRQSAWLEFLWKIGIRGS